MKILITGGCKNGKSFYGQQIINELGSVRNKFYIATMKPSDQEDAERIARHRQERNGWGFQTLEQPTDILRCQEKLTAESAVLLDSTTALLANEMFLESGEIRGQCYEKVIAELVVLCRSVKHMVLVSDFIHSDAEHYDRETEQYRFALAKIDRALARECDYVYEISFGNPLCHKPKNKCGTGPTASAMQGGIKK